MFEWIVNSPPQLVTVACSCYGIVEYDNLRCGISLQISAIYLDDSVVVEP